MLTEDWISLAVVVICLAVSFFFSASETALTGFSRARMLQLEKNGNARARLVNRLVEPGTGSKVATARSAPNQPAVTAGYSIKPPRYSLRGVATFYDAGFTAMRLPRGTVIRVCGPGGCLDRKISDYGPVAGTNRIIDLYRPDFFAVCGCPSWSGTVWVTVGVY